MTFVRIMCAAYRNQEQPSLSTSHGGEVAAPAQVEAELPRRTPVMQPATIIACRCGRLKPFDPNDAPGWVLMLGHTWEWRCPTCPRGGHGLLADRESPPRTPRRTPSAITPRFLTDLSQILDRQRKQYNTTEGGEVAAPTRVEADEHALHLQALHGHVMDHKQIAEAAEAWREAEATAGQQEAPAESWHAGFDGADWVTTDVEGTAEKRLSKDEPHAQVAMEAALWSCPEALQIFRLKLERHQALHGHGVRVPGLPAVGAPGVPPPFMAAPPGIANEAVALPYPLTPLQAELQEEVPLLMGRTLPSWRGRCRC